MARVHLRRFPEHRRPVKPSGAGLAQPDKRPRDGYAAGSDSSPNHRASRLFSYTDPPDFPQRPFKAATVSGKRSQCGRPMFGANRCRDQFG